MKFSSEPFKFLREPFKSLFYSPGITGDDIYNALNQLRRDAPDFEHGSGLVQRLDSFMQRRALRTYARLRQRLG